MLALALVLSATTNVRPAGAVTTTVVSGGSCLDVQAAIAALPNKGGRVLLLPGTYVCSTPIVIDRDKVELVGTAGTVLRLADGADAPVLIVGDIAPEPAKTVKRVKVSDITIDGNRANQTTENWATVPEIRNNGVTLRGVKNVVVERVVVLRARSGGLVVERESRNVTVRQFAAYDNHFDGLAAYRTEKSNFMSLYLRDNGYAGLSFDLDFDRNVVSDALIIGSGTDGIFMRNANKNTFKNVAVVESGEHGVFLAENVDLPGLQPTTSNVFRWLFVTDSNGTAFRVNDPSCVRNKLQHAQFADNGECLYEGASMQLADVFCH
jgi:hypothetical protein